MRTHLGKHEACNKGCRMSTYGFPNSHTSLPPQWMRLACFMGLFGVLWGLPITLVYMGSHIISGQAMLYLQSLCIYYGVVNFIIYPLSACMSLFRMYNTYDGAISLQKNGALPGSVEPVLHGAATYAPVSRAAVQENYQASIHRYLHVVFIPVYMESDAVLFTTLEFLANAGGEVLVVLATESGIPDVVRRRLQSVVDHWRPRFVDCLTTIHTHGLKKNETPGKCSNVSAALDQVADHLRATYTASHRIVVTSCDVDSLFTSNYFDLLNKAIERRAMQLEHRCQHAWSMLVFSPSVVHTRYFWQGDTFSRLMSTCRMYWYKSNIKPFAFWTRGFISNYHISLPLICALGGWDARVVPDDVHLFVCTQVLDPSHFTTRETSPLSTTVAGAVSTVSFLKTADGVASKDHAADTGDKSHTTIAMTQHKSMSLPDRAYSTHVPVELHVIPLPVDNQTPHGSSSIGTIQQLWSQQTRWMYNAGEIPWIIWTLWLGGSIHKWAACKQLVSLIEMYIVAPFQPWSVLVLLYTSDDVALTGMIVYAYAYTCAIYFVFEQCNLRVVAFFVSSAPQEPPGALKSTLASLVAFPCLLWVMNYVFFPFSVLLAMTHITCRANNKHTASEKHTPLG
jgi:hypothetical protein